VANLPGISLGRQCAAEAAGTFLLVFTGTGAMLFNELSGGAITHPGIATTFGLAVMIAVFTFGPISGAHINPAVTLGFWAAGRLEAKRLPPYIASQCAGAILASGLLLGLFGNQTAMGATLPIEIDGQQLVYPCLALETLATFILMFVILRLAGEKISTVAVVVGGTVAMLSLFAGPISGASMNPARSLGPAVASGNFTAFWIYLLGPAIGALLAVPASRALRLAKRAGETESPS